MNRRKFLANSTRQVIVLNALGLGTAGALAAETSDEKLPDNDKLIYRTLGRTGIKLPVVSMGVMNASNPNLLKVAWESGIRHFDTAWYYQNGNNEKMVGSVLRELKVKREEVTIATKVGFFGPPINSGKQRKAYFLERFAESLARLQMDYVDILYLHAATRKEDVNDPYLIEAFNELKEKKQIRFPGFSTHIDWVDLVTDATKRKFYDVILLSFNYSMFRDERIFSTLRAASDTGIGLIAMKTQCRQDWYKQELPSGLQKYYDGSNMNSALLKWALRYNFITTAIPGFTSYDQLEEDMAVAYDLAFTKEEEEFFRSRDIKLSIQSVCRQCGHCTGTCPRNTDIPSLMRTHMYSLSYGNPLLARQTMSQIEEGRGLENCAGCVTCQAGCRYRVQIAGRIAELKEIYC